MKPARILGLSAWLLMVFCLTSAWAVPIALMDEPNYNVTLVGSKGEQDLGKLTEIDRQSRAMVGFGQLVEGKRCLLVRGPDEASLRLTFNLRAPQGRNPVLDFATKSRGAGEARLTVLARSSGLTVTLFTGKLPSDRWLPLVLPLSTRPHAKLEISFEVKCSSITTMALLAEPLVYGEGDSGGGRRGYVMSGLNVAPWGGLSVRVSPGTAVIEGREVDLAEPAILEVAPPVIAWFRDEEAVLPEGDPAFNTGYKLKGAMCSYHAAVDALMAKSVLVKTAPGQAGEELERGVDYLLNGPYATLTRRPQGKAPADKPVYIDYAVSLQRIDSLVLAEDGQLRIIPGESRLVLPKPPAIPSGCLALANIHVPFGASELALANVMQITDRKPSLVVSRDRRAELPKTQALLDAGEPLTIVCLGDSVTAGGEALSEGDHWRDRLAAGLMARYPGQEIKVINSGVGGTNSTFGLERFEKDVAAYKPNLTIVMFPLNDAGLPLEQTRANMVEITRRARELGSEVLYMTSNSSLWGGQRLVEVNDLYLELGKELGVPVADAWEAYGRLPERGWPGNALLANTINHPGPMGHWIFYAELMNFFGGFDEAECPL